MGGTPPGPDGGCPSSQGWGTPAGVPTWPGTDRYPRVPPARDRVLPAGVPPQGMGYLLAWVPTWPGPDGGGFPRVPPAGVPPRDGVPPSRGTPWYRTTDRVLDTPQSVCLLHSRRRTFLLEQVLNIVTSITISVPRAMTAIVMAIVQWTTIRVKRTNEMTYPQMGTTN